MSGTLKSLLLLLVFISFVLSAFGQTPTPSAWPPSSEHTTVPLWSGGAPGASTAKAARAGHHDREGPSGCGTPRDSNRQCFRADTHALWGQERTELRPYTCGGGVSRWQLSNLGDRPGGNGGL